MAVRNGGRLQRPFDIDNSRQKFILSVHLFCGNRPARKEVNCMTEIKLKKGEPVDRALRRLKKKVDREGTLKVVRSHRHFEKPSEKRRRKEKVARFSAMLTARYADL
jgi:small subunit ribosomal protein S21